MSVIHQLLRRWGFVKLNAYGLVLTPEGRVMTTRPGVLDDGSGGRIVGWQDGDLAMAELKPWEPGRPTRAQLPAQPAKPAQLAAPAPIAPAPIAPTPIAPAPVAPAPVAAGPASARATTVQAPATYPQVISESSVMAHAVPVSASYSSVEVMSDPVASAPPDGEDDWEWTIALARARAEAADSSHGPHATALRPPAKPARPARPPSSPPVQARPARPATTPPSVSRPAAQLAAAKPAPAKPTQILPTLATIAPAPASPAPVAARTRQMSASTSASTPVAQPTIAPVDPAVSGEWPKTAPIGEIDYAEPSHAPTRSAIPVVTVAPSPTSRHAGSPPPAHSTPPAPPVTQAAPRRGRATTAPPPSLPRLHTQPTPITVIPAAASPSGPARRLGKGTVPIDAGHAPEPSDPLQAEIAAMAEMSDDTSIDLSIGDRTTPGIVMPVAARAAQVPSGKRRAAQRG